MSYQVLTTFTIPNPNFSQNFSLPVPLSFGIPCPQGIVFDCHDLALCLKGGALLSTSFSSIMQWPDGSQRWLKCDASLASVSRDSGEDISLQLIKRSDENDLPNSILYEDDSKYIITAKQIKWNISKFGNSLISATVSDNDEFLFSSDLYEFSLLDSEGSVWGAEIGCSHIISSSPLAAELRVEGEFFKNQKSHTLQFSADLKFYQDIGMIDFKVTVKNPSAAKHQGNVWDLGDQGSVFFKSCEIKFSINSPSELLAFVQPEETHEKMAAGRKWSLYQASSGGDNWNCHQHINGSSVGPDFRGYQIKEGEDTKLSGNRATPVFIGSAGNVSLGLLMSDFWQNFPKTLSGDGNNIVISLFPLQSGRNHELQAGEQKTHKFSILIDHDEDSCVALLRYHDLPVTPKFSHTWYESSFGSGTLISGTDGISPANLKTVLDNFCAGESSCFSRREIIDEYGWRNFGDLYADHEAVFHQGEELFISHYNNQYDTIKGFLLQYFYTGKPQWFQLAKELANHVIDIDIYHTDDDRYQYNHGLFWHTDHHLPAATATHRAFSKAHLEHNPNTGGGPAPDHNYATGLMLMYFMTGEQRYRDGALELVGNIKQLVLGPDTVCEHLFQTVKVLLSKVKRQPQVGDPAYNHVFGLLNGPGRASGNALNTLLDGYMLTQNQEYLALADYIICQCVSQQDDLDKMGLRNPELRWMYTIFLKSLARYIKVKKEYQQIDSMLVYARKCFLHYANWMLENEYFYLDKPDLLEFPNETWVAQEFRKADILAFAASITPDPLRTRFFDKAQYFFDTALAKLQEYDQPLLTRPLVLMMVNGWDYLSLENELNKEKVPDSVVSDLDKNLPSPDYAPIKVRTLFRAFRGLNLIKEIMWFKQRF